MPNPTAKLASFLFKERRPSQTYLELSSSRGCLAAGKVKERKRERRERREKIKAKLKNKTLFTKIKTYRTSPSQLFHRLLLRFTKQEGLYIGNLMA